MNPEPPKNPREELELRLTALLLGELSGAEAAAVRADIAKDPELTRLHDDLKQTIRLVRVAATTPDEPLPADIAQLKLSKKRRKKLLTAFAIPPLKKEHRKPKATFPVRLIEVLAVLAILALLAAMFLPALGTAKSKAQRASILNNVRQLELAKQMWAHDNKKRVGDAPTMDDLKPYLGRGDISSVAGESYSLGKVGEQVAAEVDKDKAGTLLGTLFSPERSGDDSDSIGFLESAPLKSASLDSVKRALTLRDGISPPDVEIPRGDSDKQIQPYSDGASAAVRRGEVASLSKGGAETSRGKEKANHLGFAMATVPAADAGKEVQVYLPSAEASPSAPEPARAREWTEDREQLTLGTGGGGAGGSYAMGHYNATFSKGSTHKYYDSSSGQPTDEKYPEGAERQQASRYGGGFAGVPKKQSGQPEFQDRVVSYGAGVSHYGVPGSAPVTPQAVPPPTAEPLTVAKAEALPATGRNTDALGDVAGDNLAMRGALALFLNHRRLSSGPK